MYLQVQQKEEDEEETESLILNCAKVVEYLQPLMSRELLCKFPDNSAFDFDYSQSSIWSPLIPRAYSPMDHDLITARKLSYEFGFGFEDLDNNFNISNTVMNCGVKKSIGTTAFNFSFKNFWKAKKKKKKKKASEFSPTPVKGSCAPINTKVGLTIWVFFKLYLFI